MSEELEALGVPPEALAWLAEQLRRQRTAGHAGRISLRLDCAHGGRTASAVVEPAGRPDEARRFAARRAPRC